MANWFKLENILILCFSQEIEGKGYMINSIGAEKAFIKFMSVIVMEEGRLANQE